MEIILVIPSLKIYMINGFFSLFSYHWLSIESVSSIMTLISKPRHLFIVTLILLPLMLKWQAMSHK